MVIYTLCSIFNTSKYNLGLIVMDSTEFTTDVRLKRTSDLCSLAKQLMQKIFGFPAVQRLEDADRTVVDEGISNNKHMISFFLFFAEVSSFPQNSTDHLACPINYCAFFFLRERKIWKHSSAWKLQLPLFLESYFYIQFSILVLLLSGSSDLGDLKFLYLNSQEFIYGQQIL